MHIATILYYLSNAIHKEIILPAEKLNQVLVNKEIKEAANNPRYVKLKRRRRCSSSSSAISFSSIEEDNNLIISSESNYESDSSEKLRKPNKVNKYSKQRGKLKTQINKKDTNIKSKLLASSVSKSSNKTKDQKETDIFYLSSRRIKKTAVKRTEEASKVYSQTDILSDNGWLDNFHIDRYLILLHKRYPQTRGLVDPNINVIKDYINVNGYQNCILIIHLNASSHWVTISNINCSESYWILYDSMYSNIGTFDTCFFGIISRIRKSLYQKCFCFKTI